MRIKSIYAKNYRTIEDLTINFSSGFCTISGRNNAGKSCIIRLLSKLFQPEPSLPWITNNTFDYKQDKTQWIRSNDPITITYQVELTKLEDPALISFIEKIASVPIDAGEVPLQIQYTIREGDAQSINIQIDNKPIDDQAAKEIDKKIKDSNLLFLYNSTSANEEIYFGHNRIRQFYDFMISTDEKKIIIDAQKTIELKMKKLAKEHTKILSDILGRLSEKYNVEASPLEGFAMRRMPVGINLKDKNVDIPLNDWGSGTQNRTHILMAILQANRIKTSCAIDEKITPFVVIEEPESFLHPSAQAEFGRMLRTLSAEFGIQLIVTTHSPYMLNQEEPTANILLTRNTSRKKNLGETTLVEVSGDNWMAPFADHLGIDAKEFNCLKSIFSAAQSKTLLVEGELDVAYFERFKTGDLDCEKLDNGIEIVSYGGKDTLKNTVLMQFILRRFDKVFLSYDLDAHTELKSSLEKLSLIHLQDFAPVGAEQSGKNCIEGILPERILSTVNGRETDLVMQLGSDATNKKKAKATLKKKYLEEFLRNNNYSKEELKEFSKIIKIINKKMHC